MHMTFESVNNPEGKELLRRSLEEALQRLSGEDIQLSNVCYSLDKASRFDLVGRLLVVIANTDLKKWLSAPMERQAFEVAIMGLSHVDFAYRAYVASFDFASSPGFALTPDEEGMITDMVDLVLLEHESRGRHHIFNVAQALEKIHSSQERIDEYKKKYGRFAEEISREGVPENMDIVYNKFLELREKYASYDFMSKEQQDSAIQEVRQQIEEELKSLG